MKASIHFELETPKDFEAFAAIFSGVAKTAAPADVVHAAAPVPEKQIAAPAKADKPAKPVKEKAKPEPQPEPEEEEAEVETEEDEDQAEVVDKALVAKELRAFIAKRGADTGPKEALAVLKEFGATKFDELKAEDYSKFLTKLGKA